MPNFSNYNAGRDNPDPRDYQAEMLFGAIPDISLPSKVILDQTPVLSQGSIGACTVFGSSGALFETISQRLVANGLGYKQPFDPWTVWAKAKEKGATDDGGWYLQAALQLIKDMKLSSAYVKIGDMGKADVYTMKYWLHSGKAIATGSRYGNWAEVVRTGIYVEGTRQSGHIFQINGYDDNFKFPDGDVGGFHSPNSWNGVGSFWISYKDISALYTQYYELGTEDVEALQKIEAVKKQLETDNAEKARVKGIWNGSNPDSVASAIEISTMAYRTQQGTGKLTREAWVKIIQENILRGKTDVNIWNGKEAKRIITDAELALLITRAVKRDSSISSLSLTRKQIAAVFGRDF